MASATNHRAAARSQDSAPGCPLVHAKPTAEPTRRPPSSRPIAEHPLCGPYREPQLQRAPTKRDPTSSLSRASIKALRNPRNAHIHRAAVSELTIEKPHGPAAPVQCVVMRARRPLQQAAPGVAPAMVALQDGFRSRELYRTGQRCSCVIKGAATVSVFFG